MGALPPVPGCLRAIQQFNVGSVFNVGTKSYWQYSGAAPSVADVLAFANSIQANSSAHFAGLAATYVTSTGCQVTDLSSSTGNQAESVTTWTGTRTGSGVLTFSSCALINHHITRRYRGGKPKSFYPFGVDSDLGTGATWASAFIAALDSAYSAWVSGVLATSGLSISLDSQASVSYYSGYNTPVILPSGRAKQSLKQRTTPILDLVTASTVNSKIGSQRRRLI